MITKELQAQILGLNTVNKIRLVEMLLESLCKPYLEIESSWVAKSERRYAAYKRGEIQGSTLNDVKKRIRLCS